MAGYRMTPARRAALKKAQLASAKKRRGMGKAKASGVRRRKGAAPSSVRRRRAAIAAVGAIGAAAGAGYVYKNRERLIVQPMAQRRFVKIAEREKGRKLTKRERIAVKNREKRQHSRRSVDAARAYKEARDFAKLARSKGKSINPRSKNYIFKEVQLSHIDDGVKRNGKYGTDSGRFMFELYRKDVHTRAEHRLNRMKGKKAGFSYRSGKQKRVSEKGQVKRLWW